MLLKLNLCNCLILGIIKTHLLKCYYILFYLNLFSLFLKLNLFLRLYIEYNQHYLLQNLLIFQYQNLYYFLGLVLKMKKLELRNLFYLLLFLFPSLLTFLNSLFLKVSSSAFLITSFKSQLAFIVFPDLLENFFPSLSKTNP